MYNILSKDLVDQVPSDYLSIYLSKGVTGGASSSSGSPSGSENQNGQGQNQG